MTVFTSPGPPSSSASTSCCDLMDRSGSSSDGSWLTCWVGGGEGGKGGGGKEGRKGDVRGKQMKVERRAGKGREGKGGMEGR